MSLGTKLQSQLKNVPWGLLFCLCLICLSCLITALSFKI